MKLLLHNFAFMKRSKFYFYKLYILKQSVVQQLYHATIARRASRKCCTTKFIKWVPLMISREIEINLIALIHLTLYLRFRDHP